MINNPIENLCLGPYLTSQNLSSCSSQFSVSPQNHIFLITIGDWPSHVDFECIMNRYLILVTPTKTVLLNQLVPCVNDCLLHAEIMRNLQDCECALNQDGAKHGSKSLQKTFYHDKGVLIS